MRKKMGEVGKVKRTIDGAVCLTLNKGEKPVIAFYGGRIWQDKEEVVSKTYFSEMSHISPM